jgi:hypothetical protein
MLRRPASRDSRGIPCESTNGNAASVPASPGRARSGLEGELGRGAGRSRPAVTTAAGPLNLAPGARQVTPRCSFRLNKSRHASICAGLPPAASARSSPGGPASTASTCPRHRLGHHFSHAGPATAAPRATGRHARHSPPTPGWLATFARAARKDGGPEQGLAERNRRPRGDDAVSADMHIPEEKRWSPVGHP